MCFFYHEKGKERRKEGREGGKKKGGDREVCKLTALLFILRSLIKRQIKYKREENNKEKYKR